MRVPDGDSDRLDRSAYDLVFSDTFDGSVLDAIEWIDHYLPHWTTRSARPPDAG